MKSNTTSYGDLLIKLKIGAVLLQLLIKLLKIVRIITTYQVVPESGDARKLIKFKTTFSGGSFWVNDIGYCDLSSEKTSDITLLRYFP